jgi:sulfate transport system ATP-binding protein
MAHRPPRDPRTEVTMHIQVDHVHKHYGEYPALHDVSVTIAEGELVALLGPSGSGKTTLLRVIAGLEHPEKGRVRLGGRDVTDWAIRDRNIGFVFQDYALFDHMTVAENIGFGLRVRKTPRLVIDERVRELLGLVQLDALGGRFPPQLSGGQRQRVALARALAPKPSVLLLDEPFGALDARVRQELRTWLRRLHDELHVTSVFVTHDQEEALEVADRIVVMNVGRVEQIGDPGAVFDAPSSAFVMDFLGGANVLRGSVADGVGRFGAMTLACDGVDDDERARAFIRAHDLVLSRFDAATPPAPASNLTATVTHVRRLGVAVRVYLDTDDLGELTAELPAHEFTALGLARGDTVVAHVRTARVFPEVTP